MRDVNAYLSAQQAKTSGEKAEEWNQMEEYYNKKWVEILVTSKDDIFTCTHFVHLIKMNFNNMYIWFISIIKTPMFISFMIM